MCDKYFPVLDHGFIALKDYMGSDECIEQSARVSYGQGTRKKSETRGLIRYLISNRHTSPFEMMELKFHVGMPIFVARQWIRHRTANVNEYSGRYSLMPSMYYTPKQENLTTQSANNKQGRSGNTLSDEEYADIISCLQSGREQSTKNYTDMLDMDVARELARVDLPLSTYTFWYWKIDLHNLFHFLGLRCHSHAQWEIREYAKIMMGIVKEVAPLSFEAFLDYRMYGTNLSNLDILLLDKILSGDAGDWDSVGKELGMTSREITAFRNKTKPPKREDFTLDMSQCKTGEYFENMIAAHTEKV